MVTTAGDVALLAPVPLEHLIAGAEVCERHGRVAFGSRAWELFRELDGLRDDKPVAVYIYASHSDSSLSLKVSWHARYIGHVESIGGAHPDGMKYRPSSTEKYPNDKKDHWAVFWEVEKLRKLVPHDRIQTKEFCGFARRKKYDRNFVPEGPIIISHP